MVAGVAVLAFWAASAFELFEWFVDWSRRHEAWELDEALLGTVVTTIALAVYSWRRYREADAEAQHLLAAEASLAETTERYRSLFEMNPLAVVSIDPAGRFVESNDAAKAMLGLQPGELRGAHFSVLVDPADRDETDRRFRGMMDGEPQQFDLGVRHRDGRPLDLRITGVPIVVAGRVVGAYDIIEDITVAKRVRRELEEATRAAAAANDAKSLFLANMSHEIRTPLTAMVATAELLEDTELTEEQRDLVVRMVRSGARLRRLVDSILDFSAIEAGATRFHRTRFDPGELLAEASVEPRRAAALKGLELTLDLGPTLPRGMSGDRDRVFQVVTNLLDNAVKFTESGSIVASAFGVDDGSSVVFAVTDTGIGLSVEDQSIAFETFRQLDASMTRAHGGSGLGLAICKRLVEDMDGEIWVTSAPGSGSTFAFRLPAEGSA